MIKVGQRIPVALVQCLGCMWLKTNSVLEKMNFYTCFFGLQKVI